MGLIGTRGAVEVGPFRGRYRIGEIEGVYGECGSRDITGRYVDPGKWADVWRVGGAYGEGGALPILGNDRPE